MTVGIVVAVLSACTVWLTVRELRMWQQRRALRRRDSERWLNRLREKR